MELYFNPVYRTTPSFIVSNCASNVSSDLHWTIKAPIYSEYSCTVDSSSMKEHKDFTIISFSASDNVTFFWLSIYMNKRLTTLLLLL